jgi:ATP-dependent RNA helicase RhlE
MTGDAITFVAPDEENDLHMIERKIGKRLPRVTVPDFDYTRRPAEKLEIPIQERIAAIRARKKEERARAKRRRHGRRQPLTGASEGCRACPSAREAGGSPPYVDALKGTARRRRP